MRRSAIAGIFLLIPAILVMTAAPGCGKKEGGGGGGGKKEVVEGKKGGTAPEDKKGGEAGSGKALEGKLDAVIKGQVTYDGEPPAAPVIADIANHKDKDQCLMGKEFEKEDQHWIVNKSSKGVANVVVYLEPPSGSYFKVSGAAAKPKDASIDQPHCAFIPHIVAMFPSYFDGKADVPTGQKLVVHNSAKMPHNTKITGSPTSNPPKNLTIPPSDKKEIPVKWQKNPIDVSCDFHPWMNAKILTFKTPYYAVTDLDGKFTIENVPSGAEVTVVAWHEVPGKFKTETKKFDSGDNTYDLKVKK